jgi:hypothetical protein
VITVLANPTARFSPLVLNQCGASGSVDVGVFLSGSIESSVEIFLKVYLQVMLRMGCGTHHWGQSGNMLTIESIF